MKSSKAEIRRRVEQVMKVILLGGEFHDIVQYASETDEATGRPWRVKQRMLCNYQRRAYKLIEQRAEKTYDRVFARHLQQRRQLYALAMEAGDLSVALSILKDEADLHGIYPASKANAVNVNVSGAIATRIIEEVVSDTPQRDPEATGPLIIESSTDATARSASDSR